MTGWPLLQGKPAILYALAVFLGNLSNIWC